MELVDEYIKKSALTGIIDTFAFVLVNKNRDVFTIFSEIFNVGDVT